VVGQHVDLTTGSAAVAVPLIRAGSVKAYAISSGKRDPAAPEVPTFTELGYPQLERPLWHALFVPAGTPAPVVARLNAALRDALADPQVKKAYEDKQLEAYPPDQWSPEAARAYVRSELEYWTKVIREYNIQAE
jgi:tripartite-type tricarboxylate transporter receptor subunit TctC